jgi:hypothetical protein
MTFGCKVVCYAVAAKDAVHRFAEFLPTGFHIKAQMVVLEVVVIIPWKWFADATPAKLDQVESVFRGNRLLRVYMPRALLQLRKLSLHGLPERAFIGADGGRAVWTDFGICSAKGAVHDAFADERLNAAPHAFGYDLKVSRALALLPLAEIRHRTSSIAIIGGHNIIGPN